MGWVNWSRRTGEEGRASGGLGLELTASRARASAGKATRHRVVPLDGAHADLPLAISLERRAAEVGRPGVALCRRLPHLSVSGYLPHLGRPTEWKGGRHRLTAEAAIALALDRVRVAAAGFERVYVGVPAYLTLQQTNRLCAVAGKMRFPLKGTAASALALAADRAGALLADTPPADDDSKPGWVVPMHRPARPPASADVVIVDADDYALTASLVRVEPTQAKLLGSSTLPRAGAKLWREKLLDALCDRCVRVCRRDPRDSAEAEQALYEQIDDSLDRLLNAPKLSLTVRAAHWYQDLHLTPDDFAGPCAGFVRLGVDAVRDLIAATPAPEPPRAVWLTHEACRLPGLGQALYQNMAERTTVGVLRPEAVAVALANLGDRWHAGELPGTHLDSTIPVVLPAPPRPPEVRKSVGSKP
jgi:hypothetical protein